MRKLHDLDDEIGRAERRIELHRDGLSANMHAARVRGNRTLTSPSVLLGAVVFGFLVDRLGRLKPKPRADKPPKSGVNGIVAGLAAAALRSALSNPKTWQSMRDAFGRRKQIGTARELPQPPMR
jgi:hypothetical protein